ncbi:MAG TPA: histidinol dehydrogenase [Proteobacteria bacterium]|nr:histidinol dehydrogenase [bacterium BMS3Abin14]HDL53337.1 histidinol dehydrogenase [Pseudomonadota bacterium]
MKVIRYGNPGYEAAIQALERRSQSIPEGIMDRVNDIVEDVRVHGDRALIRYTERFDKMDLVSSGMEIGRDELAHALKSLPSDERGFLETAASAIRDFHSRQKESTWTYEPEPGVTLGQKVTPLGKVGLYVPGGTAAYPSSVLMNAIPAKVAGVEEIVMVVPTPRGKTNGAVLAAAAMVGVDRVFRVGGAQAVAALAYGTETIPSVDKIVGPGNIYVAMAKKVVYGIVDIDMIAGPSEVLVLADGKANPALVAADLLSQAEHDPLAYPVLVTDDQSLIEAVGREISSQMAMLPRKEIAAQAIENNGWMILVPDLQEGVRVVNRFAPEHLELVVEDPEAVLENITCAGAIFMGQYTPEALGDYMAGPNHVLPTGGTARFFSPLGTYDFVKKSSIIRFSREALGKRALQVAGFARIEGLEAHARAVDLRIDPGAKKKWEG